MNFEKKISIFFFFLRIGEEKGTGVDFLFGRECVYARERWRPDQRRQIEGEIQSISVQLTGCIDTLYLIV